MAVQVPRTGTSVDDGLEGAEPALGRGAAPGQVDRQGDGLFPAERGGFAGQQLPGIGRAGTGDPDLLQDVLEVGVGQMDVMLRHPVRDLAQVTADMGERRPVAQEIRGQGVPGLVGNAVAEVHLVHPGTEPAVKPLVGQWHRAVLAAVDGREQREPGTLLAVGPVAVAGSEEVQGLALPFGQLPAGGASRVLTASLIDAAITVIGVNRSCASR